MPQHQPVYVICQSGMRSKKAVRQLKKQGISAIHVKGGMHQWNGPIQGGK